MRLRSSGDEWVGGVREERWALGLCAQRKTSLCPVPHTLAFAIGRMLPGIHLLSLQLIKQLCFVYDHLFVVGLLVSVGLKRVLTVRPNALCSGVRF